MKKVWMSGAGAILVIGLWAASIPGSTGAILGDYARATDFDASGVKIHCDSGGCVIPLIVPWTFQLGAVGTPYDAVATASFTYKATKGVHLQATPILLHGTTTVPLADVKRPLGPAGNARSTTLAWVLSGLDANTTYGLYVNVEAIGTTPATYDISTSDITLVVEAAQP